MLTGQINTFNDEIDIGKVFHSKKVTFQHRHLIYITEEPQRVRQRHIQLERNYGGACKDRPYKDTF
jgi:hypothetical protein